MFYYKATIQYEGTNYAGFQWQNELKTVQGEINTALFLILKCKVTTIAASRTDTGVHALEQIVKISSEQEINLNHFLKTFNDHLPLDIRCLNIDSTQWNFKPIIGTTSKEYRYFFTNHLKVSLEDQKLIANISNPLNIDSINVCLKAILGTHDFCNFYSSGSNVKSSVRTILECELVEINPHDFFNYPTLFLIPDHLKHCYQIKIVANGFLKQMIRHLVSALWMVGSGKLSVEMFLNLLESTKVEKRYWKVAAPNGLYLCKISY